MSRFREGEGDGDDPTVYLWDSNVRRATNGKNGQRILEEMRQALLAMPERKLVNGSIATERGEVCAVAAYARFKGVDLTPYADETFRNDDGSTWVGHADAGATIRCGVQAGMLKMLAHHFGFMNDVECPPRRVYRPMRTVPVEVLDESRAAVRHAFLVAHDQRWDGNYATHPLRRIEYEEVDRWEREFEYYGVTDEERWQTVYDWVCAHLRISHPPMLVQA